MPGAVTLIAENQQEGQTGHHQAKPEKQAPNAGLREAGRGEIQVLPHRQAA